MRSANGKRYDLCACGRAKETKSKTCPKCSRRGPPFTSETSRAANAKQWWVDREK